MTTARHAWPSRAIALITALISLLLLWRIFTLDVTSSILLVTAVSVGGVVSAAKMWADNSFESHVAASLVAGTLILGTLLSVTLGLPGDRRSSFGLLQGLFLVLPVMALVLQGVAFRQHRRNSAHARTPYAH